MIKKTLIFRGGCRLNNLPSKDKNKTPDISLNEIAATLLQRDYKGIGNFNSNGVIEIWKIEKHDV